VSGAVTHPDGGNLLHHGAMDGPILLIDPPIADLEAYRAAGGGEALQRARELGPGGVIQEITLSGLRGRGGGGFPTGTKWASIRGADEPGTRRFVVCNGAEGEPGTFKDRAILRADPYQVVEGVAVAALAVGAEAAFICLKARFEREVAAVTGALAEMAAAGLAGDVPISVVTGPDEYLFGEEKAMLQVVEGDAPLPRLFPPYIHGLFATSAQMGWSARPRSTDDLDGAPRANPTLVNNVETLATVTHILRRGPEWHRSLGTGASPGITIATVVGDVVRPGVGEVELGTPMREVIERVGGGVAPGRTVKAVLSGVANPVLTAGGLDAPMSYEGLEAAGAGMGSAGFIVYDDTADMVAVARMMSRFLYVESCNQCPPCKFGTGEITAHLELIERGEGQERDIEAIGARLRTVTDGNRCYLPVEEQLLIGSLLRAFPEEFVAHLDYSWPHDRTYDFPKIVDLADGVVVYDERQERKQPDWTYAEVATPTVRRHR
jgi:NADH-quinone oxidoreductase subunit F